MSTLSRSYVCSLMDNGDPPQIENAEEKEEEPYEEESAPYVKDAARQDNFPLQLDQKNFDRDKPVQNLSSSGEISV